MEVGTRSANEPQGAKDEIPADISAGINKLHLDESMAMNERTPASVQTGSENEPRMAANTQGLTQGGSRLESTISNSHFLPGRDMVSYNVTGNLTINHKYEESAVSFCTFISSEAWPFDREQQKAIKTLRGAENIISTMKMDSYSDIASGMLIPAPSEFILERDVQHNQIISKLLSRNNERVAILGMGGIGKTTLACSVANDPQIEETYPRRLFLSFEGCSTPDLAYTNLATAFQVPVDRRSSHRQIFSHALKYLKQGKALLIIDNFETFWEVSPNRRAAEDFLAQLSALPKLALIVTLRGIQRPGNIRWFRIDPLEALTHNAAKELLSIIMDKEYTKDDSEYIQKLLDAVAGIPLAVTLIGSLLRDESETPKSLWHQWTQESARAIRVANEIDSDDRLYKLDISLRLSIFGPRMSDNAKEVLAAVSILPTGLNMDDEWLDKFQSNLPTTIRIRDCIRTLRDVALVTVDSSTTPNRLRLLPPVRDFCLSNLSLDKEVACRLIDTYNTDLVNHWDWGSSEHYTWITMELSNANAILNHAITLCYVTNDTGWATYRYIDWKRLFCMPETETIERAIEILSEHPICRAKCLQGLGYTLSEFNREDEAIQLLEQALAIYKELGDKKEVGWTLYILGGVRFYMDEYDQVESYVREAGDLFTELGCNWEKGSTLQRLADTYVQQGKLSEAECTIKEALELGSASGNQKGVVTALGTLGDVYRLQGKYDLAVEKLTASRDASQATHDTREEARANEILGLLYQDLNKPDQAAVHFQLGISLYEQAQQPKGAEHVRAHLQKLQISQND